jgi:phosphomannomutase/phosphomannomutase/phosphoglucomutase
MTAFKAYDIRGRVPDQLDADACYAIGRAFAELIRPGTTVVGYDIRKSSPELAAAVTEGLLDGGSDVYDIGLCGTEEVYFATAHYKFGGGIMVTASHNPIDYNGLKLVRQGARPISGDSGLKDIEARIGKGDLTSATATGPRGTAHALNARPAYIEHLLTYVDVAALEVTERSRTSPPQQQGSSGRRCLKIIANPGNGGAGIVLDALAPHLPMNAWDRAERFAPLAHTFATDYA